MAEAASASSAAVRRLRRDFESLQRSRNPQLAVQPSEDNLLEWHFVLHTLPADTPYHGGCYHGKIIFPPEYPHAPPGILMVTPSGRLEIGKRLCLSMTDFHPESWNPAWSVETILVGLLSFFISDAESGYGAISQPEARRRELAAESLATNARNAEFVALFPEFLEREAASPAAASGGEGASELPARSAQPAPVPAQVVAPAAVVAPAPAGAPAPTMAAPAGDTVRLAGDAGPAANPAAQPMLRGAGTADLASEDGSEEGVRECWICRDTSTGEPLIEPCACRGSMSGVHASCVQQWIQRHRQSAVNDEVPRCSVCHQQYRGCEQRPGFGEFMRHMCYDACRQFLRILVLVLLLVGYQLAASPLAGLPIAVRVVLVAIFAGAATHKLLVLTVSLPPHRPPPRQEALRRFFISDDRKLAMHLAEAFAMVASLGFCCMCETLPWPFFLPVCIAALIPVGKMCHLHPSLACVKRVAKRTALCLAAPVLIVVAIVWAIFRYPHRVGHPLDAGWHIMVALIAIPLCLGPASNVWVLILWGCHSVLCLVGLMETLLVRRLQWREGVLWWIALQLTLLAAYVANTFCVFPKGLKISGSASLTVGLASGGWLLLVMALTLSTNWSLCVRYYRTWQSRHGTFTLQVPSTQAEAPAAEGANQEPAPQAPAALPV